MHATRLFRFRSHHASARVTVDGVRVEFRDHCYDTSDDALAEAMRRSQWLGIDYHELTDEDIVAAHTALGASKEDDATPDPPSQPDERGGARTRQRTAK